jgi:hypothetical protein
MNPNRNTDEALAAQLPVAVTANREAVAGFLFDLPPAAEPVTDYITDLDQRCQLFDQFRRIHQQLGQDPPTAAMLGFVMVAPIPEIQEQLSALQNAEPHHLRDWIASHSYVFAPWAMQDCM